METIIAAKVFSVKPRLSSWTGWDRLAENFTEDLPVLNSLKKGYGLEYTDLLWRFSFFEPVFANPLLKEKRLCF